MTKKMTKGLINKVNIGDGLTKQELDTAITFYSDLSVKLALLGLEFRFAWKEAFFTLERLRGFRAARNRA